MAEEKEEKVAASAEKKGTPIIMIVVLVLVGVLLSMGGTYFIVTKVMSQTPKDEATTSTASHDPGVFYKLGDAKDGILVNVGGAKASRFLKAGVVLELNPGKSDIVDGKGNVNAVAQTKILDTTMQFLRAAAIEDFDAAKQNELKKHLKDELNDRLGQGSVYDVYITSFLLQ